MEQANNTILKQSLANWFIIISLSNSWSRLIVHYPLDQLDTVIFLDINWVDQCLVSSPLCCWKLLPSDITSVNCFQTMCNCHSTELTSLTSNEELGWQVLKPNCPEQLAPQKGWQTLWGFHSPLTVKLIVVWVSKCWTLRDVPSDSFKRLELWTTLNPICKNYLDINSPAAPKGQRKWKTLLIFLEIHESHDLMGKNCGCLSLGSQRHKVAVAHEPRLRFQLRGTQPMLRRFPRNGFVRFDRQHGQIWGALS